MSPRRCNIAGAAEILGGSERTVRTKAAAGKIPGAAKLFGTWSFDISLLHAFVAQKERETAAGALRQQSIARQPVKEAFPTKASNSDYARTIQKLRKIAKQQQRRSQD